MSALNFPTTRPDSSPLQPGDQYTGDNGITYVWDGVKWVGHVPAGGTTDQLVKGSYSVRLGSDGNLTIPAGKDILDAGTGLSVIHNSTATDRLTKDGEILKLTVETSGSDTTAVLGVENTETNLVIGNMTQGIDIAADGGVVLASRLDSGAPIALFGANGVSEGQDGGDILLVGGDSDSGNRGAVIVGGKFVVIESIDGLEITGEDSGWYFDNSDYGLGFPDYTRQYTAWQGATVISDTAPEDDLGRIWFNSVDGRAYVKYNDLWTDLSPQVVPSAATYLDGLTIDDTTISTVDSTGTVSIQTNVSNTWEFGLDGTLTVPGNILPDGDLTRDLGSTSSQWRSLYVGSDTIYINQIPLTIDSGGNLTVNGAPISTGGGTANGWQLTSSTALLSLDENGTVTFPGGAVNYSTTLGGPALVVTTGTTFALISQGTNGAVAMEWVSDDFSQAAAVLVNSPYGETTSSVQILIGSPGGTETTHIWDFGNNGILTLSTASTILGNSADPNVYIETATTATTSTWTFGTDGVLTLPAHTPIIKGGGTGTDVTVIATTGSNTATWVFGANSSLTLPNGSSIGSGAYDSGVELTTVRGTLLFGNSPDIGGPSHFHIMKPGPNDSDLFFGDDYNYVLQRGSAYGPNPAYGVEIGTNSLSTGSSQQVWRFETDGNLTAPGNVTIAGSFINTDNGYLNLRGENAGPTSRIHIRNIDGTDDPTSDVNIHLQTGNASNVFEIFQLCGAHPTYPLSGGLRANGPTAPIILQTDIDNSNKTWAFGVDGRTTFPTTTAPTHSTGASGDKLGMVAFDGDYIYYCKANYTDGLSNIWVRSAWTSTSW